MLLAGDELKTIADQPGHSSVVLTADTYTGPHRALPQEPPAGRADPPVEVTGMRVLRRDRLGGLVHEYVQVA